MTSTAPWKRLSCLPYLGFFLRTLASRRAAFERVLVSTGLLDGASVEQPELVQAPVILEPMRRPEVAWAENPAEAWVVDEHGVIEAWGLQHEVEFEHDETHLTVIQE